MTQYINKDALVVEIDKRLNELYDLLPNASEVVKDNYTKDEANIIGKYTALESFSKFLDTLGVKEVDLEKEIDDWYNTMGIPITPNALKKTAHHFFELGLNIQQNISINVTDIDKVIEENGVDPNSKEAKMFKESYYMALEKLKVQKGE